MRGNSEMELNEAHGMSLILLTGEIANWLVAWQKTLPSSAYSIGASPSFQATVVSNWFSEATGSVPVCISMKQPVP